MFSRILRVIVGLLPWVVASLCVLAWLTVRVPLSGIFQRTFVFDGTSPWLNTFLPGQRVTVPGRQPEGWNGQRIIDEPVYASARVPGAYDAVEVGLEVRPTHQPFIEMGLANRGEDNFEIRPVWSEALATGWRRVTIASTTGYVRTSLPDRALLDVPATAQMVWRADGPHQALMDTHPETRTYEISLRGGQDFYFIPVDGTIDLKLSLQDMNRNRGSNTIAFRLTQGEEILWTDALGVSGIHDTSPTKVYEKSIHIGELHPGVYRFSVVADDNLFIRKITTTAEHWVMGPRLYFGDISGFATFVTPRRAWTNSQHLKMDSFHKEGLQSVRFGTAQTTLEETHVSYPLSRDARERGSDQMVEAPKGDVRIMGDGFFAFDRDRLFYPVPRRLTDASDPLAEGVQVIYTPYVPPEDLGDGWKRVQGHFRLDTEAGQPIRVSLSAPGIHAREGSIDVRAGFIRFVRPALDWRAWFSLLRRELRAAWHRL